jgi:hypothetical protein
MDEQVESQGQDITKKINKIVKQPEEEKQPVILTEDQKKAITIAWRESPKDNPPAIMDLVNLCFPDKGLDGRSLEAKAIKEFIVSFGGTYSTREHRRIGPYELSVAEKALIQDNIGMRALDLAKMLFPHIPNMSQLSRECIAIRKFVESLTVKPQNLEIDYDKGAFTPPENYSSCLKLINKYNYDVLSIADISENQKQGVYALVRYLHSPRFLKTISTFKDEENRNLFLSEFIRTTYDKPDLSVDELNLYISLCSLYPLEHMALSEREALSQKLAEEMESEKGRISEATVKAIEAKNKEYKEIQDNQQRLIKELNGSRSKRLDSHAKAHTSVLSLIAYWREEKKRQKMLAFADVKKKALKSSVEELLTFDSIKAEIFGAVRMFDNEK